MADAKSAAEAKASANKAKALKNFTKK